jgi:hypothetical protein
MKFTIAQGNNSPSMVTNLSIEGDELETSKINDVYFIMENKYEEVVIEDNTSGSVNIISSTSAIVEYVFDQSQTDTVGTYKAEFVVEYDTGAVETFPTNNKIIVDIVEGIQ